jgi:hypothetical protein
LKHIPRLFHEMAGVRHIESKEKFLNKNTVFRSIFANPVIFLKKIYLTVTVIFQ